MVEKKIGDRLPPSWQTRLRPLWRMWKHRPRLLRHAEVDRPIFVVGHPRSGTSWLYKSIILHPELAGAPESHLFDYYLKPLLSEDPFLPWGGLDHWVERSQRNSILRGAVDRVFDYRLAEERKKRVVEKTPEHALFVGEIKSLYPRAQFIHIIRDGRDVMLSVLAYAENLQNPPTSVAEAADQWTRTIRSVEQAKRDHGSDILEIRYEDIVRSPETNLSQMFDFLGEPCPEDVVRRIVEENPPSARSIEKWRRELTEEDNAVFEREAGTLLQRLGYELLSLPAQA